MSDSNPTKSSWFSISRLPFVLGAALVVAISALLQWLSFPGQPTPLLAWVALAPLFLILTWKKPLLAAISWGLSQSITFMLGGFWTRHFLIDAMEFGEWQAILVVVTLCLWSGIPHACFGWIATRFCLCKSTGGIIAAAALLTSLVTLFPYPFPADQSLTQYRLPVVIQIVELGGRGLLYFSMLVVNGLLFAAIHRACRGYPHLKGSVTACLTTIILVFVYGTIRLTQLDDPARRPITIGVVQACVVPKSERSGPSPFPPEYRPGELSMRPMSRSLIKQGKPDLIIWPELPATISYLASQRDQQQIDQTVDEIGTSLLFCSFEPDTTNQEGEEEPARRPSGRQMAHLIGFESKSRQSVTKQNLVPFGERIPFESSIPWIRSLLPGAGRLRSEGLQTPLNLDHTEARIAPLICYDEMFADTAQSFAEAEANLLVTLANDSWFGNNESLDWRLASGVFRSVETRLPWVRVGNSGYTLHADRTGRIDWDTSLPVFRRAIATYEIPLGSPTTSIYRYTYWPIRLTLVFVSVWGLWRHRSSFTRSRRST